MAPSTLVPVVPTQHSWGSSISARSGPSYEMLFWVISPGETTEVKVVPDGCWVRCTVLEGVALVIADRKATPLSPFDHFELPPGTSYSIGNRGTRPLILTVLSSANGGGAEAD